MMKTTIFAVSLLLASVVYAQDDQPQSVLFTNVMVWDGTSETLVKADVLVSKSK